MNAPVTPIATVDVHYGPNEATAACIVAEHWSASTPCEEKIVRINGFVDYKPGEFFKRELPCIIAALAAIRTKFNVIVIDGYVYLDKFRKPGLGSHLYKQYDGAFAVVGIAKTPYQGSDFAVRVLRGLSNRPLYVTSEGIPMADAACLVRSMHGESRLPTLSRRVDQLARGLAVLRATEPS